MSDGSQIDKGLPRLFDFVFALFGLLGSLPLLAFLSFLVWRSSSGGVLFRQARVGRNGRIFTLYKLRTMSPSKSGPQVTSGDDARITRIGKFLRRTKCDELPTFWNVLRGDMTLVGPRPEVPKYVDLENRDWQFVLQAKPGITDPVTLELRNEEKLLAEVGGDTEEYYLTRLQPLKLKGYVNYLGQRSWRSDLRVLWQTTMAVVVPSRSAAVGFAHPGDDPTEDARHKK